MTTALYIFDLDGTLALIEHRRHFVTNGRKEWDAFYAACVDDEPNTPVIETLLWLWSGGADIAIWSGRSDEVYNETELWLNRYELPERILLKMRPAGDYTPDDVLKKRWLDAMPAEDRERLVAVFEDRDRMCKMWRDNGVACFQVAPGDF